MLSSSVGSMTTRWVPRWTVISSSSVRVGVRWVHPFSTKVEYSGTSTSGSSSSWTSSSTSSTNKSEKEKSLLTDEMGVHGTAVRPTSKYTWRNKPLFRRRGDVRFRTGLEAAELLVSEARRRDPHLPIFLERVQSAMTCLAGVFDRNPRYAFVAKQLMEPERMVEFRVAWMDDAGVNRTTRGYRCQYSSSLGPYQGCVHFGPHVNGGVVKALGFDSVFSNALTGLPLGAAIGGADINPFDKSEAEMQRFCQSYMTELAKYVGPDVDQPTMGMGVGPTEMGYLYGQYKRLHTTHHGRLGAGGGAVPFLNQQHPERAGFGVVYFAECLLKDRGLSLKGKRCLILGSGKVARAVAKLLIEKGAVPLTFTDGSGHVMEPEGFGGSKLKVVDTIKSERGALLGRYIVHSTSAVFNDPPDVFDIACDLCFPCGAIGSVTNQDATKLADRGCLGVIEGGHMAVTTDARKVLKKRNLLYGPHTLTMVGSHVGGTNLEEGIRRIHQEVKTTAAEFNARGDFLVGANVAGFLRVANAMLSHGAV